MKNIRHAHENIVALENVVASNGSVIQTAGAEHTTPGLQTHARQL